jgi:hypothetical protein
MKYLFINVAMSFITLHMSLQHCVVILIFFFFLKTLDCESQTTFFLKGINVIWWCHDVVKILTYYSGEKWPVGGCGPQRGDIY